MTDIFLLLIATGLLLCFHDWRQGMLLCIVFGFLAGPARKVLPGEPVYLVVLVGVFVATVIAGFISRYGSFRFRHLGPLYAAMKTPVAFFLVWLTFEALVSLVRYGSPVLVGIGLLSYLAPLPAFILAYYYGLHPGNIIKFVKFYVVSAMLMLSGIYLSYIGIDWQVLKEIGVGVKIYVPGGVLDAYPGFLRSTEVAAWHAAATICLLLVLVVSGMIRWPKIMVALCILLLLGAGLLTGRRKMLMEVVIFAGFYVVLLMWFRRGAGRIVVISALMGAIMIAAGVFGLTETSVKNRLDPYLIRGTTVFADAKDRLALLGFNTVSWALHDYGIFGGGLGVASQGGQHFGGGAGRFGYAGEGGLGKITAELGLPGLLIVLWIVVSLFNFLWNIAHDLSTRKSFLLPLWSGLIAFLAANIPLFIVATQVFGDLFVLLMLGWIFGFTVALYRVIVVGDRSRMKVVGQEHAARQEAASLGCRAHPPQKRKLSGRQLASIASEIGV